MSRHRCTQELYQAFLEATSVRYSGKALAEVSPIELSHDSVSRWLKSRSYSPRAIWRSAQPLIEDKTQGVLIADDTIIDKSASRAIEGVQLQYSGNAHQVIPGIGLVNLVWHGQGKTLPVDYRLYDKEVDGKTKHHHFREMLKLAKQRGLQPAVVAMDTWYSSLANLKCIRQLGWHFVTPLKKNRRVNRGESLEHLSIPKAGCLIHLRGYGWVTVFRIADLPGRTDYVITNLPYADRDQVAGYLKIRWAIEVFHRELKQTCGLERCQARTRRAQRNHICMAIKTWIQRYKRRLREVISYYQQTWDVIQPAITSTISSMLNLSPAFSHQTPSFVAMLS